MNVRGEKDLAAEQPSILLFDWPSKMYAAILKVETPSTPPNGPALGRCKTGCQKCGVGGGDAKGRRIVRPDNR